ncbi:MAG: hypothetical protein IPF84_17060 [Proteobacteria bacterium]|nr:hypothetical protein [Pseudomonadota bacterium]
MDYSATIPVRGGDGASDGGVFTTRTATNALCAAAVDPSAAARRVGAARRPNHATVAR